jgi:hypothetical protein
MENLKEYGNTNPLNESSKEEKTEKIQVLLTKEDLSDLARKIAKKSLAQGEAPVSISHYVGNLIRKNLGKPSED